MEKSKQSLDKLHTELAWAMVRDARKAFNSYNEDMERSERKVVELKEVIEKLKEAAKKRANQKVKKFWLILNPWKTPLIKVF